MAVGDPKFRFETLLRLRSAERDVQRTRVAVIQTRAADVRLQITMVDQRLGRCADVVRRVTAANIDVIQLREIDQQQRTLRNEQDELRQILAECDVELTAAIAALVTADQEVQKFERLAARDALILEARQRKTEIAEQDDAATIRFHASNASTPSPSS